uniref:Simk1 n=1 Tax=Arundo donax TaxID=35708 RepID=A0A0A9ENS4_ARUDO
MMNPCAPHLSALISSSHRSPKKISRRSYGGSLSSSILNQFTKQFPM